MAKYLKFIEAERRTSRISLHLPNFEYLMKKATQHDFLGKDKISRYEIIKKFAIYLMGCQILRSVQIIQDICDSNEGNCAQHKLPDSLFNWLDLHSEDFEKRRSQNLFYLDMMEKYITDDCLEQKKLYNDMEMLQHYIRKLIDAYIFSKQDIVNEELEKMYEYLTKLEDMEEEFDESKNNINKVTEQLITSTIARSAIDAAIEPLRIQMDEYMIHSAVEQRCVVGVCEAKVEEAELAENQKVHLLQQQIDDYNRKISNEKMVHMHSLSTYLTLCDQYRYDLYTMHENYERMSNLYDNKIKKNLSYINWMRDQKMFYEDVIKSYHKRIAEIRRDDEAKAEAIRLEEEAKRKEEQSIKMERKKLAKKKSPRFNPAIKKKINQ